MSHYFVGVSGLEKRPKWYFVASVTSRAKMVLHEHFLLLFGQIAKSIPGHIKK